MNVQKLIYRFLNLFFRLLYHPLAWCYDWVAAVVSLGRWRGWVFSAADLLEGERILELGFGPGHLQVHLAARGLQVFGVDESAQMTRQAGNRLRKRTFPLRLTRALAQHLPFADQSFDSIVATFPSPYILQADTLGEAARVLRPNGKLVIVLSAWVTGSSLPERTAALLFRVTGESPHARDALSGRILKAFAASPFEAQVQTPLVTGGQLLVIVARKKA